MEIKEVTVDYYDHGGFFIHTDGAVHTKVLPCISVVQSTEGFYEISCNNSEFYNTKGKGVFIAPPNVKQVIVHHDDELSGKMKAHWIFINAKINDEYGLGDLYEFPIILDAKYNDEIETLYNKIAYGNGVNKKSALYRLVEILVSVGKQVSPPDRIKSLFESFVEKNYALKITAEDIADALYCSKPQVFRYSRKYFSLSPANYINSVRLKKAYKLLSETDFSVTEIALKTGFSDSLYFSKLFRKTYGTTPSQIRKPSFNS